MKELFLLLSLTLTASGVSYSDEAYKSLWTRINSAIEEDKPQTAVGYLNELEQLVESEGDTLELYYVRKATLEQLRKYNWKEANKYQFSVDCLDRSLMNDLDRNIEKYAYHSRVGGLIYQKILRIKSEEDNSKTPSADRYQKIREMCVLAINEFPKSESKGLFQNIIDSMDSQSMDITAEKRVVYPGQSVEFKVNSRNVESARLMIYSLSDRYHITDIEEAADMLDNGGFGRRVENRTISDYQALYNISENSSFIHKFDKPGIYTVMLRTKNGVCHETVYVSKVAVAERSLGSRHQIYVADAMSGKPADEATVHAYAYSKGKESRWPAVVAPLYVSDKKYEMNGFVTLRQTLFRPRTNAANIFAEVGDDKFCAPMSVWKDTWCRETSARSVTNHYIFTDRKLYRPDDTVMFKLIALSTDGEKGKVLEGQKVNVSLYAPGESKAIASLSLVTSDMGSVAGSFYIPAGNRNGTYRIGSELGSAWVRVEEYKDPGFRVVLPTIEEVIVAGIPTVQKGVVKGYAGNSVADARVVYKVVKHTTWYERVKLNKPQYDILVTEGTTTTDSEGNFEIPFTPMPFASEEDKYVNYTISVEVTDMGGETFSSSKSMTVASKPVRFSVDFDGTRAGSDFTIVDKDKAKSFVISAQNTESAALPVWGTFRLLKDGEVKEYGEFTAGQPVYVNFKRLDSGTYVLECSAECGDAGVVSSEMKVVLFSFKDRKSPVEGGLFFYPAPEKDQIDFMVGTTDNLYLVVEVVDNNKVVYSSQLHLQNSAEHITLPYRKEYKDEVAVSVYGIKEMKELSASHAFCRSVPSTGFEVKLNSLRDHTTPNTEETFTIEASSSEAMVSIYDITTDRYGANLFWFDPIHEYHVSMPGMRANLYDADEVLVDAVTMGGFRRIGAVEEMAMGSSDALPMSSRKMMASVNDAVEADMIEEESAPDVVEAESDEEVRRDFSQTLAFIPQLSIRRGEPASVSFKTRDGLSTFKVQVLAHTKDLHSGSACQEFVVSKSVMVQPNLPQFAVAGDRIALKAPVSNMTSDPISGTASIKITDESTGLEYTLGCEDIEMDIPAGGQDVASWSVKIPSGISRMGVMIAFKSKAGNDAEKNIVEIYPDSRYVTEAESFILGKGVSKESVIREMKAKYGRNDAHIKYEEYSTMDALKEVLTKPDAPKGNNMIEWLDCLYVNQMRGSVVGVDSIDVELSRKAAARLGALQKSDGGWGWFPCCGSSDELTMLFLDRMFYLRELGKIPQKTSLNKQIEKALEYVDNRIREIHGSKDYDWRSLIYFYAARMEHPNFAMSKEIQEILLDMIKKSKAQGWSNISIMEKAKLLTIYWATGETAAQLRLMASLRDYAVRNKTVGCYFPNAVMPYRAMLHTEIYAHSILAQMFAEMEQHDIAQGIFQWLLLQKHNQEWKSNMASADAIYVLLKYKAKDLKFGAVYYTYYSPLLDVKPSANEISVKRTYLRDGVALKDGDMLHVGDRITVRYDIDNTENRSFVEMKADRPACFYPVDERSHGYWNLYCSKGTGATTYYFQTLQEEDSSFSEEFYVSQEGTFNSGLVEIKSDYAPEYRGHTGAFEVKSEKR